MHSLLYANVLKQRVSKGVYISLVINDNTMFSVQKQHQRHIKNKSEFLRLVTHETETYYVLAEFCFYMRYNIVMHSMQFPLPISRQDNTAIRNVWPAIKWPAGCIKRVIMHKSCKCTVRT